jgi:Holliday junction DNA helicase RuvA
MYEYIIGQLIEVASGKAVVDVGNLAYSLVISPSTSAKLVPRLGANVKLYLSLIVREDAHLLYGFLLKEEREWFLLLGDVAGVGPKMALAITGHLNIEELSVAIAQSQIAVLCTIPGVGKKTAERLLLELKNNQKVKYLAQNNSTRGNAYATDAIRALINLGYPAVRAQKAVYSVIDEKEEDPPQELSALITAALRCI